jgi:hypothetical protein
VSDKHLTRPEKETEEEEEVAEYKITFFDAPKGLEAARMYIHRFDAQNSNTVMCNKVENELYRLRAQEEKKQKTDCLKK